MKTRSLLGFDVFLFVSTLALMTIGIVFIYSSGVSSTGVRLSNEYIKQIVWVSLGIIIVVIFLFTNYVRIRDFAPYIYVFFLMLLVLTLFVGRVVNGARSWIPIFEFGFQPSEFAKVATILFLAYYLDRSNAAPDQFRRFIIALTITLAPVGLVLLQPDMGTALVYIPIFMIMCYIAGCPLRYIVFLLSTGAILVVLSMLPAWQTYIADRDYMFMTLITSKKYIGFVALALFGVLALSVIGYFILKKRYFYWILYSFSSLTIGFGGSFILRGVLQDYQVKRLIVFLDPGIDPRGAGWNVIQSVTAVGSGGLFGKGWLQGTQSHYRFLPQQSTDFIFSILAEEWGFAGGFLICVLFAVIIFRGIVIMINARDNFASLVSAGIIGMISFHVFINIGMAMGIMPVTGIPLFFLSYGGSSLWTALIGIGLLLNIHIRRYRY